MKKDDNEDLQKITKILNDFKTQITEWDKECLDAIKAQSDEKKKFELALSYLHLEAKQLEDENITDTSGLLDLGSLSLGELQDMGITAVELMRLLRMRNYINSK